MLGQAKWRCAFGLVDVTSLTSHFPCQVRLRASFKLDIVLNLGGSRHANDFMIFVDDIHPTTAHSMQ